MNLHIFLVNGPPGSGKDEIAKQIKWFYHALAPLGQHHIHVIHERFSQPLKSGMSAFFDISEEELEAVKNTPHFGDKKATGRRGQIDMSEVWAKQTFGERILGQLMVQRLVKAFAHHPTNPELIAANRFHYTPIAIISDSGFAPEANVVIEYFGAENVTLLQLHRDGKTFAGDSRSYIKLPCVPTYQVRNDLTTNNLRENVAAIIEETLDRKLHHG